MPTARKFYFSGWIYSTASSAELFLLTRNNTSSYNDAHSSILVTETNKWVFVERVFEVPAGTIQMRLRVDNNGGGLVWFDDLRLYPAEAQMTTYTYDAFLGLSSQTNANNRTTFYEYDPLGRLSLVRDQDRHIVKQYDYRLAQPILPCASTSAVWQSTGKSRCVVDANNNPTGVQEAEERDQNNCSNSYLNTRWVSLGQTGNCVPLASCTGPNKRVVIVNGVAFCQDGVKTLVSSTAYGNTWTCTYRYEWGDYKGPEFSETGNYLCQLID